MTRDELVAVIEVVLGIHNTPGRSSTILAAVDAYATDQATKAVAGPSQTPAHDPASTTTITTERRWSPSAEVPASPFGFGTRA